MTRIDPSESIAIVGIGGIFPGAQDIPEFWTNIQNGKDCISQVPPERWDWRLYYDPDPAAPDKTYSKIGGFIQGFKFDPLKLRIPPPVAQQMDGVQQLAVSATAEALRDSGYDKKPYDPERTAVILGNSMGGPKKEQTDLRVYASYYRQQLESSPSFAALPETARRAIADEMERSAKSQLSTITEDTMPGELSNVIAGRVANAFNFNGANITVDAACASSLAALSQAVSGLRFHEYDMALSGGIDQMMSAPAFVKFCKIGALSPDGSRPFDAGANGFVMGEGAGVMVLKRLRDALKDGDRIYALIRAVGSSSDGRGKGITAPNPKGQRLAIERAFRQLNYAPEAVGLLEAHGTSTKVGDVIEANAAIEIFKAAPKGSIGLGSVKSQIGHLKAAAGAASVIKAALALRDKKLPPSIHFKTPNPGIDWERSPFFVVTELREWERSAHPRRAHVSSFGFGGTNFHLALEEVDAETMIRLGDLSLLEKTGGLTESLDPGPAAPDMDPALGGEAFLAHGGTPDAIFDRLKALSDKVPSEGPLTLAAWEFNAGKRQEYTLGLAAENGAKLKEKIEFVLRSRDSSIWEKAPPLYKAKGLHAGRARKPGKIGFLFPGQGSQYVDMFKDLARKYRVVSDTFAEADEVMSEIVGHKLTEVLFTKGGESPQELLRMEERIKQTEITQPAVLTADIAMLRLLESYGVRPDVVCGHSLGEYGALVAAGILPFKDALLAVSSRAKEMAGVKVEDSGKMASIAAPLEKVEPVLRQVQGYVVAANKNCPIQTVIAGETRAVESAVKKFLEQGVQAVEIRVSHAFHSKIVAPAQAPYSNVLSRLPLKAPAIPILSNVTAAYYPDDPQEIRKLLVEQIAAPVEFIRQVERMRQDGVRLFVEVGPKRVLTAFATSILEGQAEAAALSSNHPKKGGVLEFNDLLARLAAEGVELKLDDKDPYRPGFYTPGYHAWIHPKPSVSAPRPREGTGGAADASLIERWGLHLGPIVVSGIAAGTPGAWDRVFREDNLDNIIRGQNLIGKLSDADLQRQIDKNIVRLIKADSGNHRLERIESAAEVVKLAALAGEFDLAKEFGFKESLAHAMDVSSRLAVAAGILALKDAGIPLVRTYKTATTGSKIPTGWQLPAALKDETGVIFATAYPSLDSMASEVSRHLADKFRRKPLRELSAMLQSLLSQLKSPEERAAVEHWMTAHFKQYQERYGGEGPYEFSRDFLLRVMPLGHSQLAQWIGARGPSSQISAACASTTQAVCMAEDWIRLGRAKRVVVIAGDDVTSPALREWMISGFLAAGAATTTGVVSEAALPFDRRRHGMILGMGAAGLVIEDGAQTAQRGMKPLAEILASEFKNSAYHATRLETAHVSEVMDSLMLQAERRHALSRREVAAKALFMSHETYTPARGGSASAEVQALKKTFGDDARRIIVANTKGFTGHSMGASIEDPVAIRALVTGLLPPIANYREPDPELAGVTLSHGGEHDLEYALRLGAGFGSQIAMTLMRRALKKGEKRVYDPARHLRWLRKVSGQENPELEVAQNTLRVKEPTGAAAPAPVAGRSEVPGIDFRLGESQSLAPSATQAPKPVRVPVAVGASLGEGEVLRAITALVSEKTGYPAEMLEPDLDMEADLGIDTVKQAELIGIVREKYGIPKQENLALKDYPTLRHVVRFVLSNTGGSSTPAAPEPPAEKIPTEPSGIVTVPGIDFRLGESQSLAPSLPAPADGREPEIRAAVTALVSEKTGYPAEMLELDLDMEADLGIDTVKQAELIGIIREKYGIPKQENLALKDYPTLRHVIGFVLSQTANGTAPEAPLREAAKPVAAAAHFERWVPELYDRPLPPRGRGASLKAGTTATPLSKTRPALILSASAAAAKPFAAALKAAGVPSLVLKPSASSSSIEKAAASKPQGILCLAGLEFGDFNKSTPKTFENEFSGSLLPLLSAAKRLGPALEDSGWILTVGAEHPLSAALSGLAKALRKELPKARVQALVFRGKFSTAEAASSACAELQGDDPIGEVFFEKGKRRGLRLKAAKPPAVVAFLGPKSWVVVTGGGQGLGAELAKELARTYKPKLVIIGRTPLSKEAAEWAKLDAAGLSSLKQRMWEKLKADKSRKATPVLLEREFSRVAKAAELYRNLESMRAAGAQVHYLAADIADEAALAAALRSLKPFSADCVFHAAGLEESKLLADKTPERFAAVFRAKAHGAYYLYRHLKPKAGQRWVFFSSVVGRFGNVGQTDYAAASEFLAGLSCWMRSQGVAATAVDLTAIAEIGMATRGGVEQFLKSQGVDFMPPPVAVRMLLEEAASGCPESEVLLAGSLGRMDLDAQMVRGGAVTALPKAPESVPFPKGAALLAERTLQEGAEEIVLEKEFSLEKDPWLADHSIAGVPYVPGVMGLELFAEALGRLSGHLPGGFEDVRFSLPIKLLRNRPIAVRCRAKKSGELSIESDFITPQGLKLGGPRTHFSARLLSVAPALAAPGRAEKAPFAVKPEAIYSAYFHGPSFQVLEGVVSLSEKELLAVYLRPAKPLWDGKAKELAFHPLLTEAAFQACGYRDLHFSKKMTLPDSIGRIRLLPHDKEAPRRLFVRVWYKGAEEGQKSVYDAVVFDEEGRAWVELQDYRMIAVS